MCVVRKAFAVALVCKTKTCRRGMATARSALRNSVDERQALGTQLSGGWWCAENTGEGGWRRERYSYKCKYVYMYICKWQCRLSKQRCIGVNCNWVAMGSSTCTCLHVTFVICARFLLCLFHFTATFLFFSENKKTTSHIKCTSAPRVDVGPVFPGCNSRIHSRKCIHIQTHGAFLFYIAA